MKEFRINQFIVLKLEDEKTNIYVNDELFSQCKYLLLNILIEDIISIDEIRSIDEAAESLSHSSEPRPWENPTRISPEVEFWGHCSNLQVWVENDYNTKLIHRSLAFPLLKKLANVGDVKAKEIFIEEIAKRYKNGTGSTKNFLIEEEYLHFLTNDEFWSIFPEETIILREIEKRTKIKSRIYTSKEEYFFNPSDKNHLGFSLKNDNIEAMVFYKCTKIKTEDWDWIIDKLSHLKYLKIIGIEDCGLKFLPKAVENTSIEILLIGGNNYESLPKRLNNLKNLKIIEVDKNLKKDKAIAELKKKGVRIFFI